MGVGLVRSLQPPYILWIHWRVYNSIANTSKGVLFLLPSDVYVRSFLCPFYTLIKLCYTKALSDQVSSLALDWILLLQRPRILVSFVVQQQPFTRRSNQSILKEISPGRTDSEAESPILWPPDAKNWLIRKDGIAGKDWRWQEQGTTEDEMVGWHHWLNGHEFE